MPFLAGFFKWLDARYGVNFSVFYDAFEWHGFVTGAGLTVLLSLMSIAGSLVLGVVGAFMQTSPFRPLGVIADIYVVAFRNTPPLVQLFFFYFAVGPSLSHWLGSSTPLVGSIGWAVISLVLFAGAFNVEIFRSGIEAVPPSLVQAASSLGMSRTQVFATVILPLAARISFPALTNNLVNLIKTTTNAYAIAVPEMLYVSSQIWAQDLNTLEMMVLLLIFYFALVGLFVFAMHRLEAGMALPGWGRK